MYQAVQLDAENYLCRQISLCKTAAMKQPDWNQGQGNNQRRSQSPWKNKNNNSENRGGSQSRSPGWERGDGPRNKDSLEKGGFRPQNEHGREDASPQKPDGEKEK